MFMFNTICFVFCSLSCVDDHGCWALSCLVCDAFVLVHVISCFRHILMCINVSYLQFCIIKVNFAFSRFHTFTALLLRTMYACFWKTVSWRPFFTLHHLTQSAGILTHEVSTLVLHIWWQQWDEMLKDTGIRGKM